MVRRSASLTGTGARELSDSSSGEADAAATSLILLSDDSPTLATAAARRGFRLPSSIHRQ